jgi:hypothetical protein
MQNNENMLSNDLPLACLLSPEQRAIRDDEIREVFTSFQQVQELTDGYSFQYPSEATWADKLLHFILEERKCCPFFSFELTFEPAQGPIWLSMRGQDGVKSMIQDLLCPMVIKTKSEQ